MENFLINLEVYKLGDMGKAACPEGYRNIIDATSCNYASQILGFKYLSSEYANNSAFLCYYCLQCSPQGVYLSNGFGSAGTPICQQEKKGNCLL